MTESVTPSGLAERNVRSHSRTVHRLVVAKGIALAALLLGANAAAAEGVTVTPAEQARRSLLAPETLPSLGDVAASPLLAMFNAPHGTALETFEPAAQFRLAPSDAEAGLSPILAVTSAASDTAASPGAEPAHRVPAPGRSEGAPPDPVPTAIAAALARLIARDGLNPLGDGDWRAARAAIGAFYADRLFAPVWVDGTGLTAAGRAALAQLERAADDGLNLSAFALPRPSEGRLSPKDLAEAETTIAEAVVAYAEQASGSRIAPLRVSRLVTVAPSVADPGLALAETASAPDPGKRLADFNPPQKGYRALREELRRPTDPGPRRGQNETAVGLTAGALDDPPLVDTDIESPRPRLKTARRRLKRLVRDAGYAPPSTDRAQARRRAAILANMEMWRWEPRDMGERRIEINVPDFTVAMLDGDAIVHSARIVVGKPDTPTPIFSNVMRYVLINPSWEVPDSIIRKEMLPRLASDPNYLRRRGYEVKTVDGRLTVRQPPGEDNALGRIAFMFPNEHAVYMHDTPSQSLFDSEMRAFSHGCVRVEDPLRLAELVLGWPEERITAAIGGPERTVFLPRPVPIHIEYFTEFVDEFGALQERPDVYGLEQKVANILSSVRQD
ncbi:MAG: L,D-transpeptidase family protein [Hyphomicrobiales bacterium]|nr:L,D-transpeptidase family protein [Hyphomicrobiales bacterium]